METLQKIALVFTIIGAVVWGIYGLFDINIVASLFGDQSMIARIIYILVGICGLINIGIFFKTHDSLLKLMTVMYLAVSISGAQYYKS